MRDNKLLFSTYFDKLTDDMREDWEGMIDSSEKHEMARKNINIPPSADPDVIKYETHKKMLIILYRKLVRNCVFDESQIGSEEDKKLFDIANREGLILKEYFEENTEVS